MQGKAICVNRFCVIVHRIHVFRRRRHENDRSAAATEIGMDNTVTTSLCTSENKALETRSSVSNKAANYFAFYGVELSPQNSSFHRNPRTGTFDDGVCIG